MRSGEVCAVGRCKEKVQPELRKYDPYLKHRDTIEDNSSKVGSWVVVSREHFLNRHLGEYPKLGESVIQSSDLEEKHNDELHFTHFCSHFHMQSLPHAASTAIMNKGCAQEIVPSRPSDPSSIRVLVLGLPCTGIQRKSG